MTNDQVQMSVLKINHHSPEHCAERWPYAAYGSNLMLQQMAERCPKSDVVCAGRIIDYRLDFARFATITADPHSSVPVGIYKLTKSDIETMDRREGLGRSYDRYLITPITDDGRAVRCFTYIKRVSALQPPSDDYYAKLLRGYNDWHFEDRRLRHARDRAARAWQNPKHRLDVENEHRKASWSNIQTPGMRAIARAVMDPPMRYDEDEPINGESFRPPKTVTRASAYRSTATQNVDWGERDGQLYWRIKGDRVWYRDVSTQDDFKMGMVRGQFDETLPGARAFKPVDGDTKGIKHD